MLGSNRQTQRLLGNCPAYRSVRNTDELPQPSACPSWENQCHPQSKRSLAHFVPSAEESIAALAAVRLRHSKEHARPNGEAIGVSAARCRELGVLPSARRSCALPEEADPCSRISVAPRDRRALRPAPGIRDRPRSVSPACLAPKMGRSCTRSIRKRRLGLADRWTCHRKASEVDRRLQES